MYQDFSTRKTQSLDSFNKGLALDAEGKTHEAIQSYREALTICPEMAEAHYNLGLNLALVGKTTEAIRAWRRAVWLNTEYQHQLIAAFDIDVDIREAEIHVNQTIRGKQ